MDCRVCELPSAALVVDYFRWRNEDAHRNALNAHCYWMLRKEGMNAGAATEALMRLSVAEKNEMLFRRGINFNDLPGWQKRGCGVYWGEEEKEGFNPVTGEKVVAMRRRVSREMELPMKEAYGEFVGGLVREQGRSLTADDADGRR